MNKGYIKYMRSEESENLQSNMAANHLFNVIARRASRKGNPVLGLEKGEATIGDYVKIGMTRGVYRKAVENLVKWGYITIRTTNRGTIAKVCSSVVYDINEKDGNHLENQQATNREPTSNQQRTTIKKGKNIRKKERKKIKYILFF